MVLLKLELGHETQLEFDPPGLGEKALADDGEA